nr:MAG TPA: Protein of unknown function (DUF1430) [Caudoviricetes sp.]
MRTLRRNNEVGTRSFKGYSFWQKHTTNPLVER